MPATPPVSHYQRVKPSFPHCRPHSCPTAGLCSGPCPTPAPWHRAAIAASEPPRTAPWPSSRHGCPGQLLPKEQLLRQGQQQGRHGAVTLGRTQPLSRAQRSDRSAAGPRHSPSLPLRAGRPLTAWGDEGSRSRHVRPTPHHGPAPGPAEAHRANHGRPAAPLGLAGGASPPLCRSGGTGRAQRAERGLARDPGAHLRAAGGACPCRPPSSLSPPLRPPTSHPGRSHCRGGAGRGGSAELRGFSGRDWGKAVRCGAVPLWLFIQPCVYRLRLAAFSSQPGCCSSQRRGRGICLLGGSVVSINRTFHMIQILSTCRWNVLKDSAGNRIKY